MRTNPSLSKVELFGLWLCLFALISFSYASSESTTPEAGGSIKEQETLSKKIPPIFKKHHHGLPGLKKFFHKHKIPIYKPKPHPPVPFYKLKPHPIPVYKLKPHPIPVYKPIPISIPVFKPHPHPIPVFQRPLFHFHPIFKKPFFSHPKKPFFPKKPLSP